jgi:hypothetical protein
MDRRDTKSQLQGGNGWQEYQRLVLHELKQHTDSLEAVSKRMTAMEIQVGMLKVKSGLWGLAGGFIPVAAAVAMKLLGE